MIDVNSVLGLLIIFQVLIVAGINIVILWSLGRIARQMDELWRGEPERKLGAFQLEEAIRELDQRIEQQTRVLEYLNRR